MSFDERDFFHESFAPTFMSGLQTLWRDKQFCDIIVQTEGRDFHCHRNVLAASSEYFAFQLTQDNIATRDGKIIFQLPTAIGAASFRALINYFYSGKLVMSSANVEGVFRAADYLRLDVLVGECAKFIQDTVDESNCVRRFCFAVEFDDSNSAAKKIREDAGRCVVDEAFDVSETHEFLNLSPELIGEILCMNIQADNAEHLYILVQKWVSFDCNHRLKFLPDLLSLIPVNGFSPEFVRSITDDELLQNESGKFWMENNVIPTLERACLFQGTKSLFVANRQKFQRSYKLKLSNSTVKSISDRPDISSYAAVCYRGQIYLLCSCKSGESFKLDELPNSVWANSRIDLDFSRSSTSCITLGDELYVIGGYATQTLRPLSSCANFDFQTGRKTDIDSMRYERVLPGIGAYANSIYAAGNLGTDSTIERFDPRIGKWHRAGRLSSEIGECSATTIGKFFYCCDKDCGYVQKFDFLNNKSQPICSIRPKECFSYRSKYWITSANSELYAAREGQILKYDSEADTWSYICSAMGLETPIIVPWN